MAEWTALEQEVMDDMLRRRPDLKCCEEAMRQFHGALKNCYDRGGTFFTCGNGGSCTDAQHIVGELCKSFERKRPLTNEIREALSSQPLGNELADNLERGLPAVTLGLNSALKTAVENDIPLRDIAFAQELNALIRPGDMLLAISTSGNAKNCLMAMSVAKAYGGIAAALTGPRDSNMARHADVIIQVPGGSTKEIQEGHAVVWHTLCCLIEVAYFPEMR
jgi:D-sedoheptulose 7-phosphate isomerase